MGNLMQIPSKVKPWGDLEVALNQSIRFRHSGPILRHLDLHPEDRESAARALEEIGKTNSVCARRDLLALADEVRAVGWTESVHQKCESCRPFGADYCCPACGRMANVSQDAPREGQSAGRRTT